MDSSAIYITLASQDPSIQPGDTASHFSNNFLVPLQLGGGSDWECALFNMTIAPKPGAEVIFVNASCVQNTVTVGSQQTNNLRRLVINSAGGVSSNWETPSLLQFVPLSVSTTLDSVETSITNEDGDPVECEAGSQTFVTIALRPAIVKKSRMY